MPYLIGPKDERSFVDQSDKKAIFLLLFDKLGHHIS